MGAFARSLFTLEMNMDDPASHYTGVNPMVHAGTA
jgi:hypothetical protein